MLNVWCFEVKISQTSRSPGRLMLRPEVRHIFRTGKAYELETWYTDDAERRPVSPTSAMTSKVKGQGREVTWTTWPVWQLLADKSRTKRPRNTKNGKKVAHPTSNSFKVKRSKFKVIRLISAETESVSLTNFKFDRRLEHALSTAMASWPVKFGYCTRTGEYRVAHTTCLVWMTVIFKLHDSPKRVGCRSHTHLV